MIDCCILFVWDVLVRCSSLWNSYIFGIILNFDYFFFFFLISFHVTLVFFFHSFAPNTTCIHTYKTKTKCSLNPIKIVPCNCCACMQCAHCIIWIGHYGILLRLYIFDGVLILGLIFAWNEMISIWNPFRISFLEMLLVRFAYHFWFVAWIDCRYWFKPINFKSLQNSYHIHNHQHNLYEYKEFWKTKLGKYWHLLHVIYICWMSFIFSMIFFGTRDNLAIFSKKKIKFLVTNQF